MLGIGKCSFTENLARGRHKRSQRSPIECRTETDSFHAYARQLLQRQVHPGNPHDDIDGLIHSGHQRFNILGSSQTWRVQDIGPRLLIGLQSSYGVV